MNEFIGKYKKDLYMYSGMFLVFMFMIFLAMILQTGAPYNRVFISLGEIGSTKLEITWYATFILTGILLAAFLSYQEFKKLGWDTEILFDGLLWAVPLAILGTRLYYVAFDPTPNYETIWDVLNFTEGGLAIHGAVIVTIIFLIVFTRIKKISFWALADIVAIGFLIGQIVGRWGNFMNQEAYGPAIQSDFLINILPNFITNQMTIGSNVHHPTFLYEGIWNFIGLVFLLIARRKRWFKIGDMIGLYLIWYGLGRGAIIEPLRTQGAANDALRLFGYPINVYLSLTLFMVGGFLIIVIKKIVSIEF